MDEEGPVTDKLDIVEDRPIEVVLDDAFIARFEKAADLYQFKYLPLCLRMTNEADWVNHGKPGQPRYYLQASGGEKVATPLGITWERPAVHRHDRKDEQGEWYEYEVEGLIHSRLLGRYGWFTGNCDSRDRFFLARGPVIEGDIRKAAFSNWLINGITRLAGIRNPTPELLAKAGLNPERIGKIDYSGQASRTAEQATDTISEAQQKRLWAIAREHGWDQEQVKALLQARGIESTKDIKRAHYDKIIEALEQAPPKPPPAPAPEANGKEQP
jgi:hypothetical protein